ncbi:MAG: ribose-phosphate pyrophosphokinase-like domain-containing protein, partial [Nitrospiraceae bacterium]|nr:ribose-phosphate pyrophosphokinase-like domain-containing protein [Nitrospiraceae bacterium]
MQSSVKIFSGTGSTYLAEKIAASNGKKLGNLTVNKFSDGEFQPLAASNGKKLGNLTVNKFSDG